MEIYTPAISLGKFASAHQFTCWDCYSSGAESDDSDDGSETAGMLRRISPRGSRSNADLVGKVWLLS